MVRNIKVLDFGNEVQNIAIRSLVGQLNWLATHTRPDISYGTCELSVSFNKAKVENLLTLSRTGI